MSKIVESVKVFENVKADDGVEIKTGHNAKMLEGGLAIRGYLTVIKNLGKPNEQILCKNKGNLLTNIGRDDFHTALYVDTTATQVGWNFIAVSDDVGSPAVGDTTLTGEITTGGLIRALATTRTHTGGTNTSTVAITYTASAVHTAVRRSALFDLVTVGTISHSNTFTNASLEINDTLTVTWTLTLG